jgi:purine-binding chemotaxis protein CheW
MPRHRHDPSKNLVGFLVGDVMYAVRIEVVREIVNPLEVVGLPRAPKAVRGVADYRGVVVPVIDLRERFELPTARLSRKTKWVVLDVASPAAVDARRRGGGPASLVEGRYAALVVDAVTEVFGYGAGGIRPAPPLGRGDDVRGIEGVTTCPLPDRRGGDRLVFVLDARAFGALAEAALEPNRAPSVSESL